MDKLVEHLVNKRICRKYDGTPNRVPNCACGSANHVAVCFKQHRQYYMYRF